MSNRITKIAPQVFARLRSAPPDWLREFDAWVSGTLGPRPVYLTHRKAAEEWDCAVLGAVLAWGYFDAMLAETDAVEGGEAPAESPAGGDIRGDGAPVLEDGVAGPSDPDTGDAGSVDLATRLALGARFTVLGADGQPLIEGIK